jgi:hypothetical protein
MFLLGSVRIALIGVAFLSAVWAASGQAQEFCGACPGGYLWMGPDFDQPEFCSKCDPGYAVGFYGDDFYCAACPAGYVIGPSGEDFFCVPPGGGQATAVQWAKPYWAKVVWERPAPGSPCPPGMFAAAGGPPPVSPPVSPPPTSPPGELSIYPALAGTYVCLVRCGAGGIGNEASIAQYKNTLTFTNEGGGRSSGYFASLDQVVATDWGNLQASLIRDASDQWELRWANGTIWRRK